MSVIIRLQNLPWSANALDIRQFFRGLSIPEGGVHIVGGEMGDAFIAFSTDEDARQAMMHDREAINGIQIRLLLSSRAEMQKVIEIARQQSLLALKKASGLALTQPKVLVPGSVALNAKKAVPSPIPQPPVITASSFKNILSNSGAAVTPSFLAYQQQAGFTLITESNSTTTSSSTKNTTDSDGSESRNSRERHRADSREVRRSRSRSKDRTNDRKRHERSSRDRSRERDWTNGRRSSRNRSHSRERNRTRSRERDRSHEADRFRNKSRATDRRNSREGSNNSKSRNVDADVKNKSNISPWSSTNSYKTNLTPSETGQPVDNSVKAVGSLSPSVGAVAITSTFQNYNVTTQSLTALNNYSLSGIIGASSSDSFKSFALKNPYTTAQDSATANSQESSLPNTTTTTTCSSAIPGIFVENKPNESIVSTPIVDGDASLPQEPIAFANVNPYEKMYPTLFAQAAALSSVQKASSTKQPSTSVITNSPKAEESGSKEVDPNETNCVKISNMCPRTNYSDLRKFFVGLFIPHNGIKMLNDKHGLRVGIAYVQFTRQSSVTKALCRRNNLFKGRSVIIEPVTEQEFIDAEDSFRPTNSDKAYSHRSNDSDNENGDSHGVNNSGFSSNSYKKVVQLEPFNVLYIEDIPALATEQDIMKMFSSYSLYDILLIASPENRREFVAHVRFSREEDAKAAFEDRAHHQIGYRRVRVRPGSLEEMENAKEKIRLANEQLMKEEKAAEEEETKRKLEKLITDHITQEENRQQSVVSMDLTQDEDDDNYNGSGVANVLPDSKTNDADNNIPANNFEEKGEEENHNNDSHKNDTCSVQNQSNPFNLNLDPRRPQTPAIPSLFDLDPLLVSNVRNQNRSSFYNDPRLRNMSERVADSCAKSIDNMDKNYSAMTGNNFNTNLTNHKEINPSTSMNNTEKNFVILKNCDYNTRINDVAQLLLTASLALKHIEPLHNERQLPTGEFIVEFRRPIDAEISVQRFHNVQFRNRSLRVFPITPQEIADRLGKPFLSYIPGGNGIRMNKNNMTIDGAARNNLSLSNNAINNSGSRFGNNSPQNMNFNNFRSNNPFNESVPLSNNSNNNNINNNMGRNNILNNNNSSKTGGINGIPEKFNCPGCVLALENVPYKAQISDILRFFQGFGLTPDDIIRRFNDDGLPTGDARIAFASPDQAMSAYQSRKRKQLFGRNIFIKII